MSECRDGSAATLSLGVARVLLGGYLVWKVASFPWAVLDEWPVRYADTFVWAAPPWVVRALPVEAALAVLAAFAVVVGYRLRLTALVAAVLVGHLGLVAYTVSRSGGIKSLFFAALLLVVVALYADADRLTLDAWRRTAAADLRGSTAVGPSRPASALRFLTLIVATTYFGAGVSKALTGPLLAWTDPRSLGTYLLYAGEAFGTPTPVSPAVVAFLLSAPPLLAVLAWATILLEVGFLPVALARRPVWPFVVGLVGLHLGIAVAMGPFFVDQIAMLALVVPWGTLYGRTVDRTPVVAVVDPRDARAVRVLALLTAVDVAGRLRVTVREAAGGTGARGGGGEAPSAPSPEPLELRVGGRTHRGDAAVRALGRRFLTPRGRTQTSEGVAGDAPSR